MISEATYLAAKENIEARELDAIVVKGKTEPIIVYELLGKKAEGLHADMAQLLEHYNTGIDYYKSMQWDSAVNEFKQALSIIPSDSPSNVYLKRCEEYQVNPPSSDWDGVFTLATK